MTDVHSNLLAHINSLDAKAQSAFAEKANTTIGYLRKACSTKQQFGPAVCVGIEQASEGVFTRRDLRPDDWMLIWPELVDHAKKAA